MSFLTVIAQDATAVEQDVIGAVKTAAQYVDNVFVTDVEPALTDGITAVLKLIQSNGGQLLMTAAADAVGLLSGASWGTVVTQIVTAAEAAGATTLAETKTLAASTALQIVQAVQGTPPAVVTPPAAA